MNILSGTPRRTIRARAFLRITRTRAPRSFGSHNPSPNRGNMTQLTSPRSLTKKYPITAYAIPKEFETVREARLYFKKYVKPKGKVWYFSMHAKGGSGY